MPRNPGIFGICGRSIYFSVIQIQLKVNMRPNSNPLGHLDRGLVEVRASFRGEQGESWASWNWRDNGNRQGLGPASCRKGGCVDV